MFSLADLTRKSWRHLNFHSTFSAHTSKSICLHHSDRLAKAFKKIQWHADWG